MYVYNNIQQYKQDCQSMNNVTRIMFSDPLKKGYLLVRFHRVI